MIKRLRVTVDGHSYDVTVEVPLGLSDALVFLGFLGLMGLAVAFTLNRFPELMAPAKEVATS